MTKTKPWVAAAAIVSLVVSSVSPAWSVAADASGDYAACHTTSEADFRKAVQDITAASLSKGTSNIDYRAAVGDEWRRLDVGRTLDSEVDKAFEAVKDEQSWGSLLQSLGSENKARELTTALTERVYRSPAMQKAIEDLATGVGRSIGGRIELATSDAAGPAIECMKAFLGPRYGSTVAGVVTGAAGKEFQVDPAAAGADVTAGGVLNQTAGGITGAAILVMRRQLGNMAGRLGQRLVGSVLSRLVSVVAGGVGLVLIAKDVWDLRYGVLPIIATELKSDESKTKVQDELAASIAEQIKEHVAEIARHASDRIVEIWKEYRAAHALVLDLAERQPDFRNYLDRVRPEALPRVDEVTALLLPAEGEAGVMRRLSDGTLDLAVNQLPEPAMDIARQSRSLETAIAWNAVAGTHIDKVVELDLFRIAKPADFTTGSLGRVLALDDTVAVKRLAAIDPAVRDVLLDINPAVLASAARSLDPVELSSFAGYLTGLSGLQRLRLLQFLDTNPSTLKTLTPARIRQAVLSSKDQGAALDILLRPADADTAETLKNDVLLAWNGEVNPEILWHRHPILVVLAGVAALLLLLLLRRLFRSPRPPKNSQSSPAAGAAPEPPTPKPISN